MTASIGVTAVIQDPAASEALRRAQEAAEAAERAAAQRAALKQGNG
ncbi:hypothetical protein L0F81_22150 [Streptomyces tricolor]|uniref:Uncharacterized protein n=1 Tax=Streptomyces tricolor TaxID=68277 RepID=A0ABS9JK65_9ACTN|nr:hypothetical protein [Streptomyces tricolor]MCG0065964.1 hypothetical protein [Streptomyces tricolor]